MKKNVLISIFMIASVILSACSYGVDFAVINFSDDVLEVEYVIKSKVNSLEHTATKPYKISLSDWNKRFGNKEWHEISQSDYEFDPQTRKCKIKLNSGEVLRIASQNDSVLTSNDGDDFMIESLLLRGKNGEAAYQGKYFYKQFEEKSYSYRFIGYK